MFPIEASRREFILRVDAVTEGGRRVDPFGEVASRYRGSGFEGIPERLGYDEFFSSYSESAGRGRLLAYRPALVEWILRYPQRTGRAQDRIVSFELLGVSDTSPAPGGSEATDLERKVMMRYPAKFGSSFHFQERTPRWIGIR